jgi:Thioredoxin
MIVAQTAMLVLGTMCASLGSGAHADSASVAISRETLFKAGITFAVFLPRAVNRRAMWLANYEKGRAPSDLVARAARVPGSWRLLVVAEDRCSDSANIVPYLTHPVDAVEGLEMRIINSSVGR